MPPTPDATPIARTQRVRGTHPISIGLLGLDMSHAPEFTRRINDPAHPEHVPGARVTAAFPGGSPDFELSRSRVQKFTAEVRDKYNVPILHTPEAVAKSVDVILITAADGRAHRPLFDRIAPFKKPTFIEKPLATTSTDAAAIVARAAAANIAVMSCSTARFGPPLHAALADDSLGPIVACDVFGPMPEQEPTQPGLLWYGVHSVEILNVLMGRGCTEVRCVRTDSADLLTAIWQDGRTATFRGTRQGGWRFGATIHRERGFQSIDLLHNSWFQPTTEQIFTHLAHNRSPVDPADTLEIIRICEAANASRPNGAVMPL